MIAPGGYSRNTRPYPFVVAIIQARLGSHRFPGKMLEDLNGRPLMRWSIERLKLCQSVHQIVVATPNEELAEIAFDCGAIGYVDKGKEDDVLGRYLRCINWCSAEVVVRITGDCPLIDPELVDITVNGYLENRVDISTNVFQRTFPRGFDTEVMHASVLKRIFHLTRDPQYIEHVTLFAYENPGLFVFNSITNPEDFSRFNVSVDTPEDLDRLRKLMYRIDGITMSWKDIAEALSNGKLDQGSNQEKGPTPS